MKRQIKKNIQRNIFITVILGILLTSIGIGISSSMIARNSLRVEILSKLNQVIDSTITMYDSWLEDRTHDLESWCQNIRINAYLNGDTSNLGNPEAMINYFIELKKTFPWYEDINFAVPVKGIVAGSTPSIIGVVNISDREYNIEALKGNVYKSEISISRSTGKPVFFIANPIIRNNRVPGYIFSVIDTAKFSDKFIKPVRLLPA